MAIQILNDFDDSKFYSCFQNMIIEFHSDSNSAASYAKISGFENEIRLNPNPKNNTFWFDLQAHVRNELIRNYLKHNYALGTDPQDYQTFILQNTNSYYYEEKVKLSVTLLDGSTDFLALNLKTYLGVRNYNQHKEQLQDFQLAGNSVVKYWKGLPFTIDVIGTNFDFQLTRFTFNQTATIPLSPFSGKTKCIFSITLDNGETPFIISGQEFMLEAVNPLIIQSNNLAEDVQLATVLKKENYCYGSYFKFRNKYGGWSYYLFEKHEESIKARDIGSLNNDFENFLQNPSPTLQIGKNSQNTIRGIVFKSTELDREILEDIIDSPKIFYYLNEPNQSSTENDWLEVKLKTTNFSVKRNDLSRWDIVFDFELPENHNQFV